MKRYAISDIHGCLRSFQALLDLIAFSTADELYLLGDFTDRGPNSKGVIDYIWQLQDQGYIIHCLRGNHDQMLLDSAAKAKDDQLWLTHGGLKTLQSFGIKQLSDLPSRYLHFFQELPYCFEVGRYILVHAGLDFNVPDPMLNKVAMMWARNWYSQINRDWLGDRIIVHGHTPINREGILNRLEHLNQLPALDIDNGCVYTTRIGMNHLCAFELDSQKIYFQPSLDTPEE